MSYDLILKHTKYNWARGAQRSAGLSATAALTAAAPKPPTLEELKLTPEEQKKLAQVKAIKARRCGRRPRSTSRSSRPKR